MSFYRKYRPQVFDEIDNVAVRERILSLLSKDKAELPHAFLFTGPKGAGKTTTARLIAKLFNCEKPLKNGAPCGTCDTCKEIAGGRYMDVLELDAASNRGIDEIRTLREAIGLTPTSGLYKIYIIDEVHMLTTEAFNALLKTLEEPPVHAIFVLATTDPQKVPATIKSRCTHINFGRAQADELLNGLKRVVKAEKMDIDDDALSLLASFADGAFRDAMKLLEQVSFEKGRLTKGKIQQLLAMSEEKTIDAFLDAFSAKNQKTALQIIKELDAKGADVRIFLTGCLTVGHMRLLSAAIDPAILHKLTQAYGDLKISPIPQLPLELAIVEYCETQVIRDPPAGEACKPKVISQKEDVAVPVSLGLITLEKLVEHWKDFIEAMKPYNNSIAGVLRSSRPTGVTGGIVTIEAFYSFHQEKLSEPKTREMLGDVLKKLFGEKVKVDIVLGKK